MRPVAAAGLFVCLAAAGAAAERPELRAKFELFVKDPAESVAFYELLDFEVAHRSDHGYVTMRNGEVVVALSPVPWWAPLRLVSFLRLPPLGTEIVFYAPPLEERRQRLIDAGHEPGEIRLQSWGDRDFRVRDPDGYYVRVSEGRPVPAGAE